MALSDRQKEALQRVLRRARDMGMDARKSRDTSRRRSVADVLRQPAEQRMAQEEATRGVRGLAPGKQPFMQPEQAAEMALGMVPGVGDAMSVYDTGKALAGGDYTGAALSAVGVLPFVPSVVGMMAGRGAKTADLVKLRAAEDMAASGRTADEIYRDTGWFKGADDKWRFEIDDSRSYYDADTLNELRANAADAGRAFDPIKDNVPLTHVLGHKELFAAYPELENTNVVFGSKSLLGDAGGAYASKLNTLTLRDDLVSDDAKSVILHEIQHALQNIEDFAQGGNPDEIVRLLRSEAAAIPSSLDPRKKQIERLLLENEPKSLYRALAGEVEARNVQTRMNLKQDERMTRAPSETEDVPRDRQIVRTKPGY